MTEQMSDRSSPELPPKQLQMTADAAVLRRLPDVPIPEGFVQRAYRPGDEDGWLALLQAAGFEEWDRPRVDEYLTDPERREGSSVIVEGDTMVAATFATRIYRDGVELALLDYVISSPDRRRLGLGRAVCTAVARFHVERGYPAVSLFTDDWRLPAIGLYLSLGFEPDMHREDMPGRWDAIMAKLAAGGR